MGVALHLLRFCRWLLSPNMNTLTSRPREKLKSTYMRLAKCNLCPSNLQTHLWRTRAD